MRGQCFPILDTVMAFERLLLCASMMLLRFCFLNMSPFRFHYLESIKNNTKETTTKKPIVNEIMIITCLFLRWTVVLSCSQKSKRIPKTVQDYTWLSIPSSGVWKLKSIINTSGEQSNNGNTPAKTTAANQAFCENKAYKKKGSYWLR